MNFTPINVLSNRNFGTPATAESIDAFISAQGNRSQRKQCLKTLNKTENIRRWAVQKAKIDMLKELGDRSDDDFIWLVGMVVDTLYEDYHWSDEENPKNDDNDGDITTFIKKLVARINDYAEKGYSTHQVVDMIHDKIGMTLCPNKQWKDDIKE